MPGTTLPLDTFEDVVPVTTASGSRLENENEIEASFAENPSDAKTGEKMAQLHALKSPDAGHVDHKTGEWHSDDPLNIPAEEDNAISPQFHLATAMIEATCSAPFSQSPTVFAEEHSVEGSPFSQNKADECIEGLDFSEPVVERRAAPIARSVASATDDMSGPLSLFPSMESDGTEGTGKVSAHETQDMLVDKIRDTPSLLVKHFQELRELLILESIDEAEKRRSVVHPKAQRYKAPPPSPITTSGTVTPLDELIRGYTAPFQGVREADSSGEQKDASRTSSISSYDNCSISIRSMTSNADGEYNALDARPGSIDVPLSSTSLYNNKPVQMLSIKPDFLRFVLGLTKDRGVKAWMKTTVRGRLYRHWLVEEQSFMGVCKKIWGWDWDNEETNTENQERASSFFRLWNLYAADFVKQSYDGDVDLNVHVQKSEDVLTQKSMSPLIAGTSTDMPTPFETFVFHNSGNGPLSLGFPCRINSVRALRKTLCVQKRNGLIYPVYRLQDSYVPADDLAGMTTGELGAHSRLLELNVVDVSRSISPPQESAKEEEEANSSARPSSEPVRSQHPNLLRDILGRDDPRTLNTLDKLNAKLSEKGQVKAQEALLATLYHRLPLEQVEKWLQRERHASNDHQKSQFVFPLGRTPAKNPSDYHELARLMEKFGLAHDGSGSDKSCPALPDYIPASHADDEIKRDSTDPHRYNPWASPKATAEGGSTSPESSHVTSGQSGNRHSRSNAASQALPSYLEAVRSACRDGTSFDDANSTGVIPFTYIDNYISSTPVRSGEHTCKWNSASDTHSSVVEPKPSATTAKLVGAFVPGPLDERSRFRVGKGAGIFASRAKNNEDDAGHNGTEAKVAALKDNIPATYPMVETLEAETDRLALWLANGGEGDVQS
ncbi:hypothetical protein LTS18_012740 [Coniosporium uncinatum]|uniref:Uncharacterized protein n=1 Tax=Coniosporium uncinatum TaxID=93489 RepID=A0ACC3D919_9PEZI|nr:hypothetical protein LTS18_012740 [Coniosporium uncinatum]